ncbi:phage integrase SAM-like domain-containing protein [uncultured Draconibacterium sp.]|uniref:phage integrase SAM-like domain-containing protein n=1 Tax=uncultured Draconibacterium sp. TaxID=1573823 RepID=UPI00342591CB
MCTRKDYPLEKVDYKFLEAFDVFLKKEYKVHQNTAWNYHKHTRRVLNLAVSMDLIKKNPYSKYKVPLAETNGVKINIKTDTISSSRRIRDTIDFALTAT